MAVEVPSAELCLFLLLLLFFPISALVDREMLCPRNGNGEAILCGILGRPSPCASSGTRCDRGQHQRVYQRSLDLLFLVSPSTASARMAKTGNGSTSSSCMSCDPTHPVCQPKCQNKVNYLYYACDDICLPDGYFFDPRKSARPSLPPSLL
jgi:hypothetical protein